MHAFLQFFFLRKETFKFPLTSDAGKLSLSILEHKNIGKDRVIGTGEVDVWEHISPAQPVAELVTVQVS